MPSAVTGGPGPMQQLFSGLAGARIVIPGVHSLSPIWSLSIHPDHELIYEEFTSWVHLWFKDPRLRKKVDDLDAPLFAAMAYPRTERTQLLTLAKFIAWYFPWDDAIDDGSLYYKVDEVDRYKNDTIKLVKQSLGTVAEVPDGPHPDPAIQSFWDLGTEIRSSGTPGSNQQLCNEQCAFIASSAESQTERELEEPVTVEQYLKRREHNIAIYPLMALIYYAYDIEIPPKWMHQNNGHMKIIRTELARMGTMGNDLLSLRRELINGQFENLVPLLMYHENLRPQAAVERAVDLLHESYNRFYEAELALYEQLGPEDLDVMKAYLQACKDLITCNLHWSYGLKRYMEKDMVQQDGSVVFHIALPQEEQDTRGLVTV